ncbi:MAG: Ig-like domain-containing protein [SAR324 cluster bacterium]|nr:Ig-like domain-containing protein [SAR324 cluster bacterium]
MTFTPYESLASGQTYTVTLTIGIMDICGNPVASDYSWSFTTSAN